MDRASKAPRAPAGMDGIFTHVRSRRRSAKILLPFIGSRNLRIDALRIEQGAAKLRPKVRAANYSQKARVIAVGKRRLETSDSVSVPLSLRKAVSRSLVQGTGYMRMHPSCGEGFSEKGKPCKLINSL
jgi:hypothetical protein